MKPLIAFAFGLFFLSIHAQNTEALFETMLEDAVVSGRDAEQLATEINELIIRPIKLNKEGANYLMELGVINGLQFDEIIQHILQYGDFLASEELQQISSLSVRDRQRIAALVHFGKGDLKSMNQVENKIDHHLILGSSSIFPRSRAYREMIYDGPPLSRFVRYTATSKYGINGGLNMEEDAGESAQPIKGKLPDQTSAYVEFKGSNGLLRHAVLGDYRASFGQGLTFSNAFGSVQGGDVLTIQQVAQGFKPHRSLAESGYLRGAALELGSAHFRGFLFASRSTLDATIDEEGRLTSISLSGLHRSKNERSKRNAVIEDLMGAAACFEGEHYSIGAVMVGRALNRTTITPEGFDRANSPGKERMGGLNFRYGKLNYSVFGEVSRARTGSAWLGGCLFMPTKKTGVAMLFREYRDQYQAIASSAFGSSSENSNERGFYFGLRQEIWRFGTLSVSSDLIRSTWSTYNTALPLERRNYLAEFIQSFGKHFDLQLRYKSSMRIEDRSAGQVIKLNAKVRRENIRLQIAREFEERFRIRARIEYCFYENALKKEDGILIFGEGKYQALSSPLSILLRYTIFDTDSYDSRIYAFEQNIWGSFSIPAYSGRGTRMLFLVKYKFNRNLRLAMRIGRTIYDDRERIGSGNDEIQGPVRTDINCQVEVRW